MAQRFVDRDMVMRYHWGLGVGHSYAHKQGPASRQSGTEDIQPEGEDDESEMAIPQGVTNNHRSANEEDDSSSLNSVDYDQDGWQDTDDSEEASGDDLNDSEVEYYD